MTVGKTATFANCTFWEAKMSSHKSPNSLDSTPRFFLWVKVGGISRGNFYDSTFLVSFQVAKNGKRGGHSGDFLGFSAQNSGKSEVARFSTCTKLGPPAKTPVV